MENCGQRKICAKATPVGLVSFVLPKTSLLNLQYLPSPVDPNAASEPAELSGYRLRVWLNPTMDLRGKLSKMKGTLQSRAGFSQEGLSPVEVMEDLDFLDSFRVANQKENTRALPAKNPEKAAELMASIDQEYFREDDDFNPALMELEKLPEQLDINELNAKRQHMKEQAAVVSKRISALILEKNPGYSAQLAKVAGIQQSLLLAFETCVSARKELKVAEKLATSLGLAIVGKERKLKRLKELLDQLETIQTIQQTEHRLRELIEEGDYVRGIQLCRQCKAAAGAFAQFKCMDEVERKVEKLLGSLEEELSRAAAALTLSFHAQRFHQLASAFRLLGKPPLDASWLLEHSISGLRTASENFLEERLSPPSSSEDRGRADNADVAEVIADLGCLLWRILWSYHAILSYAADMSEEGEKKEAKLLRDGLPLIWRAAAEEMRGALTRAELPNLQFGQLLQVLRSLAIFVQIGRVHFGSESIELQEALALAARAYLKAYHRSRMEELKAFIDSEAWEACPLPRNFAITKLPEFAWLYKAQSLTAIPDAESEDVVLMAMDAVNPFHLARRQDSEKQNGHAANIHGYESQSDNEDEEEVEERARSRDSPKWLPASELPVVQCNASLNLLRLFGRYLELGSLLPSLGLDVVVGVSQLFDYYFYAVAKLFGSDWSERGGWTRETGMGPSLTSALRRLDNTFDGGGGALQPSAVAGIAASDALYAFPARLVAVESLVVAAREVGSLEPKLESLVPPEKRVFLSQFVKQSLGIVPEMRKLVYGCVGTKAVNFTYLQHAVSNDVNWAIEELLSQHSTYVDYLVGDLSKLGLRLEAVGQVAKVPREAYEAVWGSAVSAVSHAVVQAYSKPRRCSAEGRALMQLDWQQFIRSTRSLTTLKPLPHIGLVDQYIKAYYVPEAQMEQWIQDHPEYSAQQISGLLNQASHISRKTRARLSQQLSPSDGVLSSG